MSADDLLPSVLAGRCANGYERGQGQVVHLARRDAMSALCGKAHGPRSAGWSARRELSPTCPRCIKLRVAP